MFATLELIVGNFQLTIRPGGEPVTLVDTIAHLCIKVLACCIKQMERGGGLLVEQHLLLQIHAQGLLTVTQGQGKLSCASLSCSISHIGSHHELIEHRIAGLGHRQRHCHVELSVTVSNSLTAVDLVTATRMTNHCGIPVAVIRPPPESPAAHDLIAHLRPLYRHACKAHGRSLHRQGVTCGIGLFHLGEVYMERRTLVFLNAETVCLTIHRDRVCACQTRRRQSELHAARAIGISGGTLLSNGLIVGITQLECHRLSLTHLLVHAVSHLIEQSRGKDLLSRTIDGTVGIQTDTLDERFVLIEAVTAIVTHLRTGFVRVCPGVDLLSATLFLRLVDIFAICVGYGIRFHVMGIVHIIPDSQMGSGDGLSSGGIDHHIAHTLLAGLILGDGIDIGDMIQVTDGLRRRTRTELHHIDTYGQAFQHQGVLEELIGSLAGILASLLTYHPSQQGLDLFIALLGIGRLVEVATAVHTVDAHLQRFQVPHIGKSHLLRLSGQRHLKVIAEPELGIGQLLPLIAEGGQARPFLTPLA